MIVRLVYTTFLAILAPFFMYNLLKRKDNKPSIGARWKELFGITPALGGNNQTVVWIHAVSVGEVIAATPFIKLFAKRHPEKTLVLTTTTPTGAQQAESLSHITEHRYMPIDFSLCVKKFIHTIKPNHLIIVETELWPNTLHTVKNVDISLTVINARLSQKSCNNYKKIPRVHELIFSHLDLVLCHNENDKARFEELGVDSTRLTATGSMKFDIDVSDEVMEKSHLIKHNLRSRLVWIAASTHTNEEKVCIDVHSELLRSYPDLLLIIVPRHPERFNDVFSLCSNSGFTTQRRSQQTVISGDTQIYLADTMGEMLPLLGASDLCFMGGSLFLHKTGGHNVLEPAAMGTPCLIGPSYYNFKEIVVQLEKLGGLKIVTRETLTSEINSLLSDNTKKNQMSQLSQKAIEDNKGSIKRSLSIWESTLDV